MLLLSADNQRLEPAAYISYQQPDHPGTQGSPSLPASHTPSSIDPLKLCILLSGDVGEFYLFLSCVPVFTQGNLQSPKKIYTLTMEEEEEDRNPPLTYLLAQQTRRANSQLLTYTLGK